MIRRLLVSLGGFVLAAVVALGVTFIRPAQMPEPVVVELPHSSKVSCPVQGKALAVGTGEVKVEPVGGAEPGTLDVPGETGLAGPTDLRANAPVAGGVLVSDPEAFAPCTTPVASGIVIVPNPSEMELLLVNGDSNEAAVDLTLLGPSGEMRELGARGIALTGGTTRRIALSVLAETGPVGVAFDASLGRVALTATNVEGRAARFAPSGTVAKEHIIAGISGEGSGTQLLISNPFEDRVDVTVSAMGESSTFTPAAAEAISVPARSTLAVDIGSDLAGEASGLRISGTAEIGTAVVTTLSGGRPASLADSAVATKLGAYVPARAGKLLLTNPGNSEVSAKVRAGGEETTVTVPAGRSVQTPVAKKGGAVSVEASGALAGSVTSGTLIIPLGATGAPETITGAAVLDPGLR